MVAGGGGGVGGLKMVGGFESISKFSHGASIGFASSAGLSL